ncbi:MAG: OsmC family protein [Candidatus Hermodarchaeota archaeon]
MKVVLNYNENLHFTANVRHFSNIHIDEPESFHGTDLGPSSVEYVLIGIGGCLGTTFFYCLKRNNILINNIEIIVDGTLKHTEPKKRLRLVRIDVEIFVDFKEKVPNEKIELCKTVFQDYCPLSNLITQGLPLNIRISEK